MAREYFCAYHSFLKSIEPLNYAERGRLFTACLEYSMTGEVPELGGNERFLFPMMKEQIDRDNERYRAKCETQTKNAFMRWHPTECHGMPSDANDAKTKAKAKTKENERPTVSKPPLSPFDQAVEDFKAHRKGLGKKMTPKAVDLMLKRLEEMAPGDDDRKIAILNQSIERGWLGVFDLKDDHSPSTGRLDNLQRLYQEVGE